MTDTKSSPIDYSQVNPLVDDPIYQSKYSVETHLKLLQAVKVHPDGQPWKKCCGSKCNDVADMHGDMVSCICKRGLTKKTGYGMHSNPFVCVHRMTEDGFLRVCAGWHVLFGEKWDEKRKLQANAGRTQGVVETKTAT
jgi:hypothetical protein